MKLIDADALKAWMAQFTEYAGYETAYHFEAQLARYIDTMPDAGCARTGSTTGRCEAGTGGSPMSIKERIEAEIDRLEKCRDVYAAYEAAFDAYNEGIGALESILADLPEETPFTLEEFRQSGKECVITYKSIDVDTPVLRNAIVAHRDGLWWRGAAQTIPEHSIAAIARMPRFYPVEAE